MSGCQGSVRGVTENMGCQLPGPFFDEYWRDKTKQSGAGPTAAGEGANFPGIPQVRGAAQRSEPPGSDSRTS